MLKAINIKNFKCFKQLELENIKDFNIISGKNNSGKTSVLDAIYAFYGVKKPTTLAELTIFKKESTPFDDNACFWSSYFNDLDESNGFEFLFSINNYKIKQTYTSKNENKENSIISVDIDKSQPLGGITQISTEGTTAKKSLDIKVTAITGRENKQQVDITITPDHIDGNVKASIRNYKRNQVDFLSTIVFISTSKNVNKGSLIDSVSTLIKTKRKEELIKYIQIIDNRIKDIAVFKKEKAESILVDIGLPEMTDITMLGEGVGRLLIFISHCLRLENSIILIDEIENGIHYSILKELVVTLISINKKNKNQLFTTTHSKDLLDSVNSIISDSPDDMGELISYTRIDREDEKKITTANEYDNEEFTYSLENNWEIR